MSELDSLTELDISNCNRRQLYRYLQFYRTYPGIVATLSPQLREGLPFALPKSLSAKDEKVGTPSPKFNIPPEKLIQSLSYSHFELLIDLEDDQKRAFYEIECICGNWSVRELKRQIASLYYERTGLSQDREKLAQFVQSRAQQAEPKLSIRDPYVFEFLGLKPAEVMSESRLEDQLLDKLQEFLLELGPIPEGWAAAKIGDVVDIHDSKRIPLNSRERAKRKGPYSYYGATGIMDYIDDYLFEGIYVLVGEDGSVIDKSGHPITQYVWGKLWVNNHAHVLTGKGISNELLYLILKNVNIRSFVTGAVQPKVNQKNLKSIPLIFSTKGIANEFESRIDLLFKLFRIYSEETQTLTSLRDTLLPKLISGELRVPDV